MKTMRGLATVLMVGFACAGCMSVSWDPPPRPIGTAPDSLTSLRVYEEMVPHRLQTANTVLLQYGWRRVTGVGFLDVNTDRRNLGLLVTTPSGTTLFEIACTNGEASCRFKAKPFLDNHAMAAEIPLDVQRMYLDLVPPANAEARIKDDTLIARGATGTNVTEWVFGAGNLLLEKRFYEASNLVAQVGYYEYSLERGRRMPRRVMLHNVRHGYGLTVTQKELLLCE